MVNDILMRIILRKGKQKELIFLAKNNLSWNELGKLIHCNPNYLCNDLKEEKASLPEKLYNKLCKASKVNFEEHVIERKEDHWGQSIGARNSVGSLKKIKMPKQSEELAEIVGAILGDGHVMFHKRGKKIGVYQINITGHITLDRDYHLFYLKRLFENLFEVDAKEVLLQKSNARRLVVYSRELVTFFIKMGLRPGDKIKNQTTIPEWILKKEGYIRACLRGLIDTDGSIHRMSKRDNNLIRLNLTNYDSQLLKDSRKSFITLGFHPSKIIKERHFFLSRQEEIAKYLKEIGFSNKKHKDRLNQFKSPVF